VYVFISVAEGSHKLHLQERHCTLFAVTQIVIVTRENEFEKQLEMNYVAAVKLNVNWTLCVINHYVVYLHEAWMYAHRRY
jgi:hypothetical protein